MAQLALQDFREHLDGQTSVAPIVPTLQPADDVAGDDFDLADRPTFLAVRNPTAGAVTITFAITSACTREITHALDCVVPTHDGTNEFALVGPFNRSRFANGAPVSFTYSAPGLLVGAVRL